MTKINARRWVERAYQRLSGYIIKNRTHSLLIGLALVISLTPFYTVGYLIFIAVFAGRMNFLNSFRSHFSNFVLVTMILMSSIMIAGIFTSLADIPNFATINLILALFFCLAICHYQRPDTGTKKQRIDVSDIVSMLVALAVPVAIMIIQFGFSSPNIALFKLVNADGWDNVPHLSLMQMTTENRNYFYSTSPIDDSNGPSSLNYPQGWHLASGDMINGIIPGVFNPSNYGLSATFAAFVFTIFAWFTLGVYVLGKVVWWMLPRQKKATSTVRRAIVFSAVMLLPILPLFISILPKGYENYLGLLPYVVLVVAASYQLLEAGSKKEMPAYLVVTLIMATSVGLMWVLPAPPLLLLIAITVFAVGAKLRDLVKNPIIVLTTILAAFALLAYLYILIQDVSPSHLYVSTSWLVNFPSFALVTIFGVIIAVDTIRSKLNIGNTVVVIAPIVVYVFAMWVLAYLSDKGLGYYHAKMFGVLFVVIAVFACASLIRMLELIELPKVKVGYIVLALTSLGVVSGVLIMSDQGLDLRSFWRSQYYLTPEERKTVTDWMVSDRAVSGKEQMILLRKNVLENRNNSMLYNRLSIDSAKQFLTAQSKSASKHVGFEDTCLLNIYYDMSSAQMAPIRNEKKVLSKLADCVDARNKAGLGTIIRAHKSSKPKLEAAGVKNARIVYYDVR